AGGGGRCVAPVPLRQRRASGRAGRRRAVACPRRPRRGARQRRLSAPARTVLPRASARGRGAPRPPFAALLGRGRAMTPARRTLPVTDEVAVPLDEIELRTSRSSGPGGQPANGTPLPLNAL